MKTISFTVRQIILASGFLMCGFLYLFFSDPNEEVAQKVILLLLCMVICLSPFSYSGKNDQPIAIIMTFVFGLLFYFFDISLSNEPIIKNLLNSHGMLHYAGMVVHFFLSVGIVGIVIRASGGRSFEKREEPPLPEKDHAMANWSKG